MESWKPLNDEDLYAVSSEGRIWCHSHRAADGRTMKAHFVKCTTSKKDGYVRFNYAERGKRCCKTLHRAVAELFVPNPKNKPEVNHINGDKTDNRAENLEWCTASENQYHALAHGLRQYNDPSHSKKVVLLTTNGLRVRSFPSVAEASRQTKIPSYTIYRICEEKVNRPLGGYYWKYSNE